MQELIRKAETLVTSLQKKLHVVDQKSAKLIRREIELAKKEEDLGKRAADLEIDKGAIKEAKAKLEKDRKAYKDKIMKELKKEVKPAKAAK